MSCVPAAQVRGMPEAPDTSIQWRTSHPPRSFPYAVGARGVPRHPAGKSSAGAPVFAFLPLLEDMKRKTEPSQGCAGALCLLPSRCATYEPKNLQALAQY